MSVKISLEQEFFKLENLLAMRANAETLHQQAVKKINSDIAEQTGKVAMIIAVKKKQEEEE